MAAFGLAGPLVDSAIATTPARQQVATPAVSAPTVSLTAVSCAAAPSCMTVGSYLDDQGVSQPFSASWNGTAWTQRAVPLPTDALNGSLTAVSCPSTTFCAAVGQAEFLQSNLYTFAPVIALWNGTSWQVSEALADLTVPVLTGVSCSSPTFCTAVGQYATGTQALPISTPISLTWNGTGWTTRAVAKPFSLWPYKGTAMGQVSCSSATHCVAVAYQLAGLSPAFPFWHILFVAEWNGTRWTAKAAPLTFAQHLQTTIGFNGISCPTDSACFLAATNVNSDYLEYSGGTFTQLPITSGVGISAAISCASATNCLAVGTSNGTSQAARWNGSSWGATAAPAGTEYSALSCLPGGTCVAVSSQQGAPTASEYNGSTWTSQTVPTP